MDKRRAGYHARLAVDLANHQRRTRLLAELDPKTHEHFRVLERHRQARPVALAQACEPVGEHHAQNAWQIMATC